MTGRRVQFGFAVGREEIHGVRKAIFDSGTPLARIEMHAGNDSAAGAMPVRGMKARDKRGRLRGKLPSRDIAGLISVFHDDAYKHVTLLHQDELDVEQLEDLLKPVARTMLERDGRLDSPIRKDIRILDFLKDGPDYPRRLPVTE